MKRFAMIAAAAVVAAITAGAICAYAGFVEMYYTRIVHKDGYFENTYKVWVNGDKYRIEPSLSYEPIIIASKKDDVMYTLDRDTKTYTQDFFRSEDLPYILVPLRPKERKNVGQETVDGRECIKAEITVEDKYGDEQKEVRYYDMGTQRLLKVESEDGEWSFTLKDVDPGRQDESLFEVPDGYKKY